ncbi:hypothetical protein N0V90_006169 [Kalmusia sp. IMI 367209]|nr:hypothetical protein N0V90_006169 [Kalmusia sp. IMI 367209]
MGGMMPDTKSQAGNGNGNGAVRDYSQPLAFDLRRRKPNKTVDIGQNGISLSLDAYGRILQASTFHPEHGIVVAVPFEQFDGTKFYDPTYVRSYRKRMLQLIEENRPGFGLDFETNTTNVSINIRKANGVTFAFSIDRDLDVLLDVLVLQSGDILQTATVQNNRSTSATLKYENNLCVSLNRASYGQLTEGGPIPLPMSHNVLQPSENCIVKVSNSALGAQLAFLSEVNETPNDVSGLSFQEVKDGPLNIRIPGDVEIQAGASSTIRARFRLSPGVEGPKLSDLGDDFHVHESNETSPWKQENTLTTYILRRNVDYILANCTIPISDEVVCIITDHVALPLGWNRDNYWQIRLLFETHKYSSILFNAPFDSKYTSRIHAVAKGHLGWVFKTAQRPHGYWHRSYLVTGKPKDHAIFQLDQQCYPLLELCDYLDYFSSDTDFVRNILDLDVVPQLLDLLESKRDEGTSLWPTDETPGDDAVIYPYHFSSHVLLWRTLTRLRDLYTHIYSPSNFSAQRLDKLSGSLRTSTLHSFTVRHPDSGLEVFAYLTDGKGSHTFYHDANDIPTLFCHHWSFLLTATERLTWHNTMAFGLSPANNQGFCNEGRYPGLGSVHSPGAWVLGYYQELAYAALRKQEGEMREAWRKEDEVKGKVQMNTEESKKQCIEMGL